MRAKHKAVAGIAVYGAELVQLMLRQVAEHRFTISLTLHIPQIANVVVDRMDNGFLANVNERAVQLRTGLAKLPMVKSLSGIGLMVGVEFFGDVRAADVLAACREKGLLVLTAKTRLRLLPPLTLSEHDVDMALEILSDVLGKMETTAPKEQA